MGMWERWRKRNMYINNNILYIIIVKERINIYIYIYVCVKYKLLLLKIGKCNEKFNYKANIKIEIQNKIFGGSLPVSGEILIID